MKYYIIAGEASGDLHGSNLMKALKDKDPQAEFRFWGGDKMAEIGGTPIKHIKELAFMGLIKVILNIRTISQNMKMCKKDILDFKPDVFIPVDYAGFNLRIAEHCKKHKIPVHYYISPKIWAWKTNRIKKIKRVVDKMLVILPFETTFYKKHDFEVEYVGNPVVDAIGNRSDQEQTKKEFCSKNNLDNKPIIALLAGSRTQEIKLMLPRMIETSKFFPNYLFIIAGAPGIDKSFYKEIIGNQSAKIVYDQTYQLLKQSSAAMVTSGTATLETALLRVPELVCYHTNIGNLLYKVARKMIKVEWLSLVNLILNREVIHEYVQDTFKIEYLVKELNAILNNPTYKSNMLADFDALIKIMGNPGASERAAESIIKTLSTN